MNRILTKGATALKKAMTAVKKIGDNSLKPGNRA